MTFSFVILALLLITTNSAMAKPTMILSAVIRNVHDKPVECTVHWATFVEAISAKDHIIVASHQVHVVPDKDINMGTWVSSGFIDRIECGSLSIASPFPLASGTQRNWEFRVEANRIVSVGRSPAMS